MRPIIFPYKVGSKGATALAVALGTIKVFPARNYIPRPDHLIINWGMAGYPQWWPHVQVRGVTVFNLPGAIANATDKVVALRMMTDQGVNCVRNTQSKAEAEGWLQGGETNRIYCRTLTRASEGRGIVVADTVDEMVQAPLYTAGVRHRNNTVEYRVHVFRGEVIDFVQKRKMNEDTIREREIEFNRVVRNHNNGWVFARQDVELPDSVANVSIAGCVACSLDFGAVDVIVSNEGTYVLEINTAPGLEGTTLDSYTEAIRKASNV